jgi:hypothetical protein
MAQWRTPFALCLQSPCKRGQDGASDSTRLGDGEDADDEEQAVDAVEDPVNLRWRASGGGHAVTVGVVTSDEGRKRKRKKLSRGNMSGMRSCVLDQGCC